jgi:hypothetical protein
MEDGKVTFRWNDYAHGGKKRKMTLLAEEFIRRFLLHVLPKGFTRIRHCGWMANRCRRQRAALCRQLLGAELPPEPALQTDAAPARQCPFCGGTIEAVEIQVPRELSRSRRSRRRDPDSSWRDRSPGQPRRPGGLDAGSVPGRHRTPPAPHFLPPIPARFGVHRPSFTRPKRLPDTANATPPVPKPHTKSISAAAASAANASGSLQTALSKVTRQSTVASSSD